MDEKQPEEQKLNLSLKEEEMEENKNAEELEENQNSINNEKEEEKEQQNSENNFESESPKKENIRYPEEEEEKIEQKEQKVEQEEENEEEKKEKEEKDEEKEEKDEEKEEKEEKGEKSEEKNADEEEKGEEEKKIDQEEEKDESQEDPKDIQDSPILKKEKIRIKKLPKISKMNKNLTDGNINHVTTTNTSENIITNQSSEFTIMKNKIEDFCHPKIRNQYYYNLKSLDNIFKTKKLMIEQNRQIFKKKELTAEERELEQLEELRKIKNPFTLTHEEKKKYLDLYNCDEMEENLMDLKKSVKKKELYKNDEFNTTKFNEYRAFKIFYNKMRKNNEIFRKGGDNIKTPSFNLIRAANKFRAVPNPIGVVKRKGEANKMELNNKLVGDNYVKCICESLKVSEHITEINLRKNRLSDISVIPLFQTIINNPVLLKQITLIDLSYNKIGIAATELMCKYMSEYNCNLEHLNLESNNLGNNNAKKIINTISNNLDSKIRYLNLGQNTLDDDIS